MVNSVDNDQTAPSVAVLSGSALFAYSILSDSLVFTSSWNVIRQFRDGT